jgi:hypothetical protein
MHAAELLGAAGLYPLWERGKNGSIKINVIGK